MVSKSSLACNQSLSSTISSFDRILHNGLLDTACNKLFEFHCHEAGKSDVRLDSSARIIIVDYTTDIIKRLCDPSVPHSITEVRDRIEYSFPPKLRPSAQLIDEFCYLIDKGKKKATYLSADKVFTSFKSVCPRIEPAVSLFLTHLIEYTLGRIICWAVRYESKLNSGLIEETEIQHVSSLLGTPNFSQASVCQSLPFLQRQSSDYIGHAKELQFFLRSTVEHLAIVVRVFADPIMEELSQVIMAAQSTFVGAASGCELALAAVRLRQAARAAQQVFSRITEVYSNMSLLSECVEDVFEGQSRLLGTCLLEPAEDETFQSFAYYTEALFSSDCRTWSLLLTETPCFQRALNNSFQRILRTVVEKASSRRLVDLETRYSDPHTCSLCTSGTGSDVGGAVTSTSGSSGTSYSNSSHMGDSPQTFSSLSGLFSRVHTGSTCTCSVRSVSSVADPPGSIPVPVGPAGRHSSRCTTSPSSQHITGSNVPRLSTVGIPIATTLPLRKTKKKRATVGGRSVGGSPSPPASTSHTPFPMVSTPSDVDGLTKQSPYVDIKVREPGLSTSSSSSSALNEGSGTKSDQDSGSHSFENRHGLIDSAEQSPSNMTMKELQACLMELFPSQHATSSSCSHMVIAFRYLLPQLLQLPTLQLLYLYEVIEALHSRAVEDSERSVLMDVLSVLSKTRLSIQNSMSTQDWVRSTAPRLANFLKTPLSGSVLSPEAQSNVEDLVQTVRRSQQSSERFISVSDFVMDGVAQTRTEGNRSRRSDRILYLFTNWILLCKKQRRVLGTVVPSTGVSSHSGLKVKKRVSLEQFHLVDTGTELSDNNEVLFTFDLEYWEIPRRGSLAPDPTYSSQTASVIPADLHSLSSTRTTNSNATITSGTTSALPTGATSHLGSLLSISTLTSTNTLIGGANATSPPPATGDGDTSTAASFHSPMPTAGAAIAAASAAMLGALSAAPTQRVTFIFPSQEAKTDWMAALIYLQLARLFKRYIRDLPRQEIPLVLPSPTIYRFAAPDSITNVLFDSDLQDSSVEIPVIRAATMLKLIERMTYHAYFDRKTVNVFLLTYRRYITPLELLDLLTERFKIPEPDFAEAAEQAGTGWDADSPLMVAVRLEKRFRSVYKRRVQYRVLNFIIKWVKNSSFYKLDIAPDPVVCRRLLDFVDSVDALHLAENVANIRKSLRGDRVRLIQTIQQLPPDQLDLGLVTRPEDVRLTNVHPLELARQITLYEWELYSRIEFWEVNGKEKIKAPNLQASLDFSNKLKWWLVHSIMTADHLEDRVIMLQRVADLAMLFEQLNNLQGAQEAKAALLSAPVFRLHHTFDALYSKCKTHHRALFDELRRSVEEEDGGEYVADYEKKLHEVNPPGLPFIAVGGKTHLIHLELKYPDWITVPNNTSSASPASLERLESDSVSLINFWKCHQIANLVEYYLSFQQTPYNFKVCDHIRTFLQTFDPLKTAGVSDEHGFDDLMHEKSLQFQPKPPAEPVLVTERRLTPVEQRVASLLNTTAPDHRMTADSKEFRHLLQCASLGASAATFTSGSNKSDADARYINQPNEPALPTDPAATQLFSTGSLGRGRSRPDSSKLQHQHAYASGRIQSNTGGFRPPYCPHHHHHRGARSASSSPAPSNLNAPAPTFAPAKPMACSSSSSPPPIPPRGARYTISERNPEQFVNQSDSSNWFPPLTRSLYSSSEPQPTSLSRVPTHVSDGLSDHRRDIVSPDPPPCIPPRPLYRKHVVASPNEGMTVEVDATSNSLNRRGSATTPSFNPDLMVGFTSGSTRILRSEGPRDPCSTHDSPPTLPPRIHARAPSSSAFTPQDSLTSATSIAVDPRFNFPSHETPPPLPPKRHATRNAF
ncbi:hypothetical protein CRM22_000540 [Opisthorchis felineus]|uniref:Ras-GEF domain-containing protein n=1 Tax=Opisthorchis felineus TaxID=147828 RepID=A0A4S2MJ30_OPIFE|nr:hypothetical protein CRM22_000540 [Opisthorchis felineus]